MPVVKRTSKTYLRALQVSHVSMCISIIGFSVFCLVAVHSGQFVSKPFLDENVALMIGGAASLFMFLVGQVVYKSRANAIPQQTTLGAKTTVYRTAMIVRLALFNSAAIISIVLFLLNGYVLLLCFPALMMVLILLHFPNRAKMLDALQPTFQEMEMLDDPDAVINEKWYSRRI
jgi:hypothetical protein